MKSLKAFLRLLFGLKQPKHQGNFDLNKHENNYYHIRYPKKWLISKDKGVVNIYPKEDYGAITISMQTGINFPIGLTRSFLLGLYHIQDNPENVKMQRKGDLVIFTYEHHEGNVYWYTKAFRKGENFYLVTANCEMNHWPNEKDEFISAINSFALKN